MYNNLDGAFGVLTFILFVLSGILEIMRDYETGISRDHYRQGTIACLILATISTFLGFALYTR